MYGTKSVIISPKYLRRLLWFCGIGLAAVLAIMGMLAGIMGGGVKTMSQMDSMKRGMDDMNGQMTKSSDAVSDFVIQLKGKFPSNQPEVTTRQILGIIENAHQIAARTQYLMNHVEPEDIGSLLKNVNKVLGAVSPQDLDTLKTQALQIIQHVDALVTQIDPTTISNALQMISSLDSTKINSLIGMVGALHEIKIQL